MTDASEPGGVDILPRRPAERTVRESEVRAARAEPEDGPPPPVRHVDQESNFSGHPRPSSDDDDEPRQIAVGGGDHDPASTAAISAAQAARAGVAAV